jgi:hypothetical protein
MLLIYRCCSAADEFSRAAAALPVDTEFLGLVKKNVDDLKLLRVGIALSQPRRVAMLRAQGMDFTTSALSFCI